MPKIQLTGCTRGDKSKLHQKFTKLSVQPGPSALFLASKFSNNAYQLAGAPADLSLPAAIGSRRRRCHLRKGGDTGCLPAIRLAGQDKTSCGHQRFVSRAMQRLCLLQSFLSNSYMKVLSIDYGNRSQIAVHDLLAADTACNCHVQTYPLPSP
jgi:hypothetical protein